MNHREIIKRLKEENFEAFTVGGCVRDQLLGIAPHDYDIVSSARPEEIIELFSDRNVKEVGKSFGVILVDDYEVATYRFDNYDENDLTVKFANTLQDDLLRRDLTINAIAYDEDNKEFIDISNGVRDLEDRIIRFVGNPAERIDEDPCRILRACRFLAKVDGEFAPSTFTALNRAVVWDNRVLDIAPERIRLEILKAMEIPNASRFFEALHSIGALEYIFPSMASCWDHEHGNHHIENVWDHCMIAGDSINTKNPMLKLTGYLHDCGKPESFNTETLQFLRHEVNGAWSAKRELEKLTFTNDEIQFVYGLIRSHMYSTMNMSGKAVRKFLKRLDERKVELENFFRIRMADRRANTGCEPFRLREWIDMIKNVKNPAVANIPFNTKQLALKGKEIISELNLEPGPVVGEIQRHLLDFVIERGPAHNNKVILLVVARNFINV